MPDAPGLPLSWLFTPPRLVDAHKGKEDGMGTKL